LETVWGPSVLIVKEGGSKGGRERGREGGRVVGKEKAAKEKLKEEATWRKGGKKRR
jgi:hypothetical protein